MSISSISWKMLGISWTLKRLRVNRRPTSMPCRLAVADPVQGGAEGARHGPEAVVDLLHAVQADADVAEQADLFQGAGHGGGDQGAVGGNDRPHPLAHGVGRELRQIFAHERLAAGEKDHRHAEGRQIVQERFTCTVVESPWSA